ncbi:MAG TPA: hypothetical protein PKZ93_10865, partial [Spirochaetota bacterium]|nr:hypothetical protein [Spirochaetota bacterium]
DKHSASAYDCFNFYSTEADYSGYRESAAKDIDVYDAYTTAFYILDNALRFGPLLVFTELISDNTSVCCNKTL